MHELRALLTAWMEKFGDEPRTAADALVCGLDLGTVAAACGCDTQRVDAVRLGVHLSKVAESRFDGQRFVRVPNDSKHKGAQRWRVVSESKAARPPRASKRKKFADSPFERVVDSSGARRWRLVGAESRATRPSRRSKRRKSA